MTPDRLALLTELLFGATTGVDLLERLGTVLGSGTALRLRDPVTEFAYAVFGEAPEELITAALATPHQHACRFEGLVVAVLTSTHDEAPAIAALLGPALVNLQSHEAALGRLALAEEKNRLLTEAGNLLKEFDPEALLVKTLQTALTAVGAELGALLEADSQGQLQLRTSWGLSAETLAALRHADGRPLAMIALHQSNPMVWDRARLEAEADPELLARFNLENLLIMPLSSGERHLGVCLLVNAPRAFDEREVALAEVLCRLAAIALDNARMVATTLERERLKSAMDLAQQVQQRMYPAHGITCGRFQVTGRSVPCDETGGDYYQFLELAGALHVIIGDVSGHGLGAALYTTMAHAGLLQALRQGHDPSSAFALLTTGLTESSLDGGFMTAFGLRLDPADGSMVWTNAGHNPPLLVRRDGSIEPLETQGFPLGLFGDSTYDPQRAQLRPGDRLVLYTDGVVDVYDGSDNFGDERFAAAVLARAALPPEGLIDGLIEELRAFAKGQAFPDDVTLMVLQG